MFNLAACTAGRNPPINPIKIAKIKEVIIIKGESANENVNSENELKFKVDTEKNWSEDAITSPIAPPIKVIRRDSIKKADRILRRLKPNDLRVPISTVLLATAAYMVIVAPIIAPKLKIIVIKIPSTLIKVAISFDWSSKYVCSILGSNC